MRIGVLGAGHVGGNLARLFARAGHEAVISFAVAALRGSPPSGTGRP